MPIGVCIHYTADERRKYACSLLDSGATECTGGPEECGMNCEKLEAYRQGYGDGIQQAREA